MKKIGESKPVGGKSTKKKPIASSARKTAQKVMNQPKNPAKPTKKIMEKEEERKNSAAPFSKITSIQRFTRYFPDYQISKRPLVTKEWDHNNSHVASILYDYIASHAYEWIKSLMVLPKRNNQSCLYPFLFQILKNVALLNNHVGIHSNFTQDTTDPELLDAACKAIAAKSKSSTQEDDDEAWNYWDDIDGEIKVPEVIDTSDPDQVRQLFLAVEQQLLYEHETAASTTSGRIEFAIKDKDMDQVIGVVEAKFSLRSNHDEGFYQTAPT